MRTVTLVLAILLLPFIFGSRGQPARVAELEAQVDVLTAALQEAQEVLQFVRVVDDEMSGLIGKSSCVFGPRPALLFARLKSAASRQISHALESVEGD